MTLQIFVAQLLLCRLASCNQGSNLTEVPLVVVLISRRTIELVTYSILGQSDGLSNLLLSVEMCLRMSWFCIPGYGPRPKENTSQQVTPNDH